jgi:hypothetical protein
MLYEIVYMLAGHCTPTINKQCYIPVNFIVAEHGVKFCESLPTALVLIGMFADDKTGHVTLPGWLGCDSTSSLYRTGKHVSNTKLQDLWEIAISLL